MTGCAVFFQWLMGQRLWSGGVPACLLVGVLLSGCAAPAGKKQRTDSHSDARLATTASPAEAAERERVYGLYFSGRMAVVVRADGVHERARQSVARFELQSDGAGEYGRLTLASPVGAVVAQLQWSPDGAAVTDSSGDESRFDSFAAMMHETVGMRITARTLLGWMQPADGGGIMRRDGWTVDTTGYSAERGGGRIRVHRSTPLPEIQLTLILEPA